MTYSVMHVCPNCQQIIDSKDVTKEVFKLHADRITARLLHHGEDELTPVVEDRIITHYNTFCTACKELLSELDTSGVYKRDEIDQLMEGVTLESTLAMLRFLAIYFKPGTRRLVVPKGSTYWKASYWDPARMESPKEVIIPIMNFFGIFLGYSAEIDTLVWWRP